jgi:hypothetical protein
MTVNISWTTRPRDGGLVLPPGQTSPSTYILKPRSFSLIVELTPPSLLDHPLHTLQPPQQAEMLITAACVLRFLVRLNSCNHTSAFALTRALPPADYSAQCSPLPPPPNLFSSLQPPPPLPPPDAFTGVTGAMMTGDSIGVASAMDPLSL